MHTISKRKLKKNFFSYISTVLTGEELEKRTTYSSAKMIILKKLPWDGRRQEKKGDRRANIFHQDKVMFAIIRK